MRPRATSPAAKRRCSSPTSSSAHCCPYCSSSRSLAAARKAAAEGIEALKEVSGSVDDVLATLVGGVQSGMGYLGARHLGELRSKARFVRVTPAGQREAAPHDVIEVATRKG